MNKRLLILLPAALLLGGSFARAQEVYPLSLVVEQKTAPQEVIPLKQIQKITFENGAMQMHYYSADAAAYPASFRFADVVKCLFSSTQKPTELLQPVKSNILCVSAGASIRIQGVESGIAHQVALYDMQGNLLYRRSEFLAGDVIPAAALPAGVYIVAVDGAAYKVIR